MTVLTKYHDFYHIIFGKSLFNIFPDYGSSYKIESCFDWKRREKKEKKYHSIIFATDTTVYRPWWVIMLLYIIQCHRMATTALYWNFMRMVKQISGVGRVHSIANHFGAELNFWCSVGLMKNTIASLLNRVPWIIWPRSVFRSLFRVPTDLYSLRSLRIRNSTQFQETGWKCRLTSAS